MTLVVWPDLASCIVTRVDADALLKTHPGLRVYDIGETWTGKYLVTEPPPTHPRLGLKEPARGCRFR